MKKIILVLFVILLCLPISFAWVSSFLEYDNLQIEKGKTESYKICLQNTNDKPFSNRIVIEKGQEYITNLNEVTEIKTVQPGTKGCDLPIYLKLKIPDTATKSDRFEIIYGLQSFDPNSTQEAGMATFAPIMLKSNFFITLPNKYPRLKVNYPENNEINVSLNPFFNLSVSDEDNEEVSTSCFIYKIIQTSTKENGEINIVEEKVLEELGTGTQFNYNKLEFNKTYEWFCNMSDGFITVESDTYKFTTEQARMKLSTKIWIGVGILFFFYVIYELTSYYLWKKGKKKRENEGKGVAPVPPTT